MYKERKRIAVLQPFIGNVYRGSETFFIELTQYLSKYYDIDIYGTNIDETVKDMMVVANCKKSRIFSWYEDLYNNSPKLIWLLNRSRYFIFLQPLVFFNRKFSRRVYNNYLKHKRYDLIFPGNGWTAVKQSIRYRKKHGTPVIYTGGGGIGPGEWKVLKLQPDKYICISSKQLRWAQNYWNQVCLIPNGVILSRFKGEMSEKKFCINKGNKLVISVGHLDTNFKRHQLAIKAISKLKGVDLLILGKGEADEEFMELANRIMPGRCIIRSVHYSETPYYYKSADLFTLPSRDEPFGIVYIEAMAAGLPIVATNDEVRREIIGDAGILCNVENVDEYAQAIRKALQTDWGDKPKKKAECYDYSVVGEQYHQLIEELIEQHPYHD